MTTGELCELLCLDLPRAETLRRGRLTLKDAERLAQQAAALGNSTRLTIATALHAGEELCVCDLAWVVERSDKLVSHHLHRLRAAGLVRSRPEGKMVLYALTEAGDRLLAGPLAEASERAS